VEPNIAIKIYDVSEFREKMSPDYVTLILWFVDRSSNSETKTPNLLKIEPGLM
jgi:hypothetical protein